MNLVNEKAEQYAARFTSSLGEVLEALEKETLLEHSHAHMISGHVQGIFLQMISHMIKPLKVLEIGSFTGFSAICLAKGLRPGGTVHTIEIRDEDAAVSEKNFARAGLQDHIKLHKGNALEIIPLLEEAWDLVFIDAGKLNYIQYYELTLPVLKPGGFILADNTLFHGQVLEEQVNGKNALAIQHFNEHVAADKRVEQVMLTVRDGLTLIRKL
ncbi:MAG: O-methyltransferase [Ferruginibacter sp.]